MLKDEQIKMARLAEHAE